MHWVDRYAEDSEEELLLLEPRERFDPALVGIGHRFTSTFAVYDQAKVLAAFAEEFADDEDPELAAIEWFEYNVIGGWVGDGTPCFIEYPEEDS